MAVQNRVKIVIDGQDNASDDIRKVSSSLDTMADKLNDIRRGSIADIGEAMAMVGDRLSNAFNKAVTGIQKLMTEAGKLNADLMAQGGVGSQALLAYNDAMTKLTQGMNEVKLAFAEALAPALTELVNFLVNDVIPAVKQLIEWFNGLPEPMRNFILTAGLAGIALMGIAGKVLVFAGSFMQLVTGLQTVGTLLGGLAPGLAGLGSGFIAAIGPIIAAVGPVLMLVAAIGMLALVIKEFGPEAFESLKMLGTIIGYYLGEAWNKIREFIPKMMQAGSDLVKGLWDGFVETMKQFIVDALRWIGDLLDRVKLFLGIRSPSLLFAEKVGKPIAQGIGLGFARAMPGITRGMGASLQAAPAAMGLGRGYGGGGVTVVYSPTFSAASMQEFENKLVPLIDKQLSLNQRRRVERR